MPVSKKFVNQFIAKHPNAKIIMVPPNTLEPEEVIAEAYRACDGSSSVAYALIGASAPHYHAHTRETYLLVDGVLHLRKMSFNYETESSSVLYADQGHFDIIHPNTVHSAECVGKPAEVMVISVPAYDPADSYSPNSEPEI